MSSKQTEQEKKKKSSASSAAARKKSVTVVEVKLGKSKAKKASTKKVAKKKTTAAAKKKAASAKKPPIKKKAAAKKAPAKKAAKPKASVTEIAKEDPQAHLKTPSVKALNSFRRTSKKRKAEAAKKIDRVRKSKKFLAKPPRAGKKYVMDLRIHAPGTVGYFSSEDVDPGPALVRLAKIKGLNIIALTDYYNAAYIDLVRAAAEKSNLSVVPGLILRGVIGECDDVYLVALFPESYTSVELYDVLNSLGVPQSAYGSRDYCLQTSVLDAIKTVEAKGGAVIPSRLDKTPYRKLAIPYLVEECGLHTFDMVHPEQHEYFRERWPEGEFTFLSFSKADALAQIGNRTSNVKLTTPGFDGIKELVVRR